MVCALNTGVSNDMNLGKMLETVVGSHGGKTAIIFEDRRFSYTELNRAVNSLANHLGSLGISKGDRVAIMLPNVPEFPIAYFACLKIGAVAATLNVLSTSYELKYLLDNSDAKALITAASSARRYEDIKDSLSTCRHLLLTEVTGSENALADILARGPFEWKMREIGEEDPAVMIYTSGLMGYPLGAVLTHGNLLSQTTLLEELYDGTEKDCGLNIIPLFHSYGAATNMIAVLKMGARMVMLDQFNLDSIFQAVEREKVTHIAAVPRVFLGMLLHEDAGKYDISSLKFCVTGGSTMPPAYIPKFHKRFNVGLHEGYGLTEASPVCSTTRIHMPIKPGSIGVPINRVEAKIVDDRDRELPPGETGELVVRGPNVMQGYYKDPEATAQVIRNGWLHTGDLAMMDGDGYIFLKGRKKRMIITSSFNVYPREVEMVLEMHPAVKSARVVGKPDLMRGEIVKAQVVKKEGETADEKTILRHCRAYLSSYKLPREIEFVDHLS